MAKGYTKMYDIDYEETFSPIVKLNTSLYQYDMRNAFLYEDLEKEVYMDIQSSYFVPLNDKLQTLYGLKQSPSAWYRRFNLAMKKYDYQYSNANHTLFLNTIKEK
ncbi:Copia protein, partial [Mucuna pruriens]